MAEQNRHTRLQRLKDSGFEMSSDSPDITGWPVKNEQEKTLGEIEDLIFDMQEQKVRYLVMDLSQNDLALPPRKVLVPIGIAEIDEKHDYVSLPGITHQQLAALPEYDQDRFDTEHEESVFSVFGGLGGSALTGGSINDRDFYDHSHFSEDHLYQKRRSRDMN